MREIKFRGKSKMAVDELDEMHFIHDNGWFVGNLIMYGKQPYIVGDLIEVDSEYIIHDFWVPVHKESIGQYTGLTDKNGTGIYEGDIVQVVEKVVISGKMTNVKVNKVVKYKEDYAQFLLYANKTREHLTFATFGEVIGSIHENPELLEVE